MPQTLGRFRETISDTATGEPVVGASVEIRRQGATVSGDQSGASPFTIAVHDLGGIVAGDLVSIGAGSDLLSVASISATNRTITLSGFVGTLGLTDSDRFTPLSGLSVVFTDIAGLNTGSNPLITDANGTPLANGIDPAYVAYGPCDYLVSGGTPDVTATLVEDVFVSAAFNDASSSRYGVRIDNVTDDGVALNNAIKDKARTLAGGPGGVIVLPKGTLLTSVPIIGMNKVRVIGEGPFSTIIKPTSAFTFNGTTDSLARIGDGSGLTYGCRFENLQLDCDGIANSIGVYTTEAAQQSGLHNVLISNAMLYGFFASGTACGNYSLVDVDVVMSSGASAASAKGIYIYLSTGVVNLVRPQVRNSSGSGTTMLAGIHCAHTNGWQVVIMGGQVRQTTNGVKISSPGVVIDGLAGHGPSSVTDVVLIDSGVGQVSCRMIFTGGATNAIHDVNRGVTLAGDNIPFYETGIAGDNSLILFDDLGTVGWKVQNPVTWSGAQTFSSTTTTTGAATFNGAATHNAAMTVAALQPATVHRLISPSESVAAAATTSVTKNTVLLTGAGPITIATIQIDAATPLAAHDGFEVMFVNAGSATFTFDQTGNIIVEGGATITLTSGASTQQCAAFRYLHNLSTPKWVQVAPKAAH